MIDPNKHLQIGSLVFDGLDQIDLTGPFEVLSRIPNATYRIFAKGGGVVRDMRGLGVVTDGDLDSAPPLDLVHIAGGFGQEALMEDEVVLDWVRRQAGSSLCVFSVCTGALICGAAGLLQGRRATTHWASFHLLSQFGATPVDARVVEDDKFVFAAGVTAGIDGALRVAARLRGDEVAQFIQLYMAYAPEPPFNAGTPETAPPEVLARAKAATAEITTQREATARRVSAKLGLKPPEALLA